MKNKKTTVAIERRFRTKTRAPRSEGFAAVEKVRVAFEIDVRVAQLLPGAALMVESNIDEFVSGSIGSCISAALDYEGLDRLANPHNFPPRQTEKEAAHA